VASGESGDEATWRDLIANYAAEPVPDGGEAPWPERENLDPPRLRPSRADPGPAADPARRLGLNDDTDPSLELGDGTGPSGVAGSDPGRRGSGTPGSGPAWDGATGTGSAGNGTVSNGTTGDRPAGNGSAGNDTVSNGTTGDRPAGNGSAGNGTLSNGATGDGAAGHHRPGHGGPGRDGESGPGDQPAPRFTASQPRIIRPASPGPPPGDEDFVPPDPPPLPALDPVAKGSWAALLAGPGYLLIATLAGWAIPGWAAFLAVAAFIGGFATLVVRMGDKPAQDSGPDDGAVL